MIRPPASHSRSVFLLTLWVVIASWQVTLVGGLGGCLNAPKYECPNCGGFEVSDCQSSCPGFLSTDSQGGMCIDRVLFTPGDGYSFVWNDIVATVLFFILSGIAISSGVGGGGMYVPLGILLLQFAPKEATGLSQCSILGAGLGGFILNVRGQHPFKTRGEAAFANATEEEEESSDKDTSVKKKTTAPRVFQQRLTLREENAFVANGGLYYTRPLIDYDLVMYLAPNCIAGALVGVTIQRVIPNWLFLIVAGLILTSIGYMTLKKAIALRKKETAAKAAIQAELDREVAIGSAAVTEMSAESTDDAEKSKRDVSNSSFSSATSTGKPKAPSSVTAEDEENPFSESSPAVIWNADLDPPATTGAELTSSDPLASLREKPASIKSLSMLDTPEAEALRNQFLQDAQVQYPGRKMGLLALLWVVLSTMTILMGGRSTPSVIGLTCQSPWFYVLMASQFTWLWGFASLHGIGLMKKQKQMVAVHYPFLPDDILWDRYTLILFGFIASMAGVVGGLIGTGGGNILNPMMMQLGVNPFVSVATVATMIVMTSSSVAIVSMTSQLVPYSYALFFFGVTFSGALILKFRIDKFVRRTGRLSYLVFALALIILFSTLGVFYSMFSRVAAAGWCLEDFKQFCPASSSSSLAPGECPVD